MAIVVPADNHALGTTEGISVHLARSDSPSGFAPHEHEPTAGSHDQALQSASSTPEHQDLEEACLHSQHRLLLSPGVRHLPALSPHLATPCIVSWGRTIHATIPTSTAQLLQILLCSEGYQLC